jgi:hypothetical protein
LASPKGVIQEPAISLPPIYGWLTGGFDTPDLQDAKTLLDELRE